MSRALIGTNAVQARIHEFGGVITPKRAKFLHFFVDGDEVFAKRVVIPARPWLRPAIDQNGPAILAAMSTAARAQIMAALR